MITSLFAVLALGYQAPAPDSPPQAAPQTTAPARPQSGHWWAWLDSPGGPISFGLELALADGVLSANILNGPESIAIPRVSFADGELVLAMDHYDSAIRARLDPSGLRLDGTWERRRGPEEWTRMPFAASAAHAGHAGHASSQRPSAVPFAFEDGVELPDFSGRWAVQFGQDEHPAVGVFSWSPDARTGAGREVVGTFLTTLGDYRFLAGTYRGRNLELSCFDGAHAFLFTAALQPDGTLRGDFWSRDTWHETWTARRDADAALPDAFELTRWTEGAHLADAAFPDTQGVVRRLDDPAFAGKARILVVFGTWCPNCNDEAPFLAELDRRYRDRGLAILGLAFELTGDAARDARQVERFRARYGIEFPVLVAGMADKAAASEAFPLLDRVRSYPTTVFLDGEGAVRAVHTGYAGPAAGREHEKLRADFERLIEELLGPE